jgi:hypothetical protein
VRKGSQKDEDDEVEYVGKDCWSLFNDIIDPHSGSALHDCPPSDSASEKYD